MKNNVHDIFTKITLIKSYFPSPTCVTFAISLKAIFCLRIINTHLNRVLRLNITENTIHKHESSRQTSLLSTGQQKVILQTLPMTCSVQHLWMCRARKVVNFAISCLPTWLTLSISSRQGNGRWLEVNWDHVYKFWLFQLHQKLIPSNILCHVCKDIITNYTFRIIFFCYIFLLSLVFDLVFKIDILGKIKAMSLHQFTVRTIANVTNLLHLLIIANVTFRPHCKRDSSAPIANVTWFRPTSKYHLKVF